MQDFPLSSFSQIATQSHKAVSPSGENDSDAMPYLWALPRFATQRPVTTSNTCTLGLLPRSPAATYLPHLRACKVEGKLAYRPLPVLQPLHQAARRFCIVP